MAAYDNLLANVPTDLWIGGKWKKSSDGARFDVIEEPADFRRVAIEPGGEPERSIVGERHGSIEVADARDHQRLDLASDQAVSTQPLAQGGRLVV